MTPAAEGPPCIVDPPDGAARPSMLSQPEPACLVIADITRLHQLPRRGRAGPRPGHPRRPRSTTVVGGLRPTFRLAKLEGDAAFAYVVTATVDGSPLQDIVERTYFAFRRRLRDIGQASTCECNACIRIPQAGPQGRRPPRQGRPPADRRPRGARRVGRHRRPPSAQERRRRGDRVRGLRAVHRRLRRGDGDRRPGRAGLRRAPRGIDVVGRGHARGSATSKRPGPEEQRSDAGLVVGKAMDSVRGYETSQRPAPIVWD